MEVSSFAILIPFCIGWASLAGKQAFDVRKSHEYRSSWAWVFWAVLPVSGLALLWFANGGSEVTVRNVTLGLLGAVLGASALIWAGYALQHGTAKAQSTPSQEAVAPDSKPTTPNPATSSGNFSINQQGGSVNQTYINQVPERLIFSDALGRELLAKIGKDRPVEVIAVGSNSDMLVGRQIHAFLRDNGYSVTLETYGMIAEVPEQALTMTELPSVRRLIVAPSVR